MRHLHIHLCHFFFVFSYEDTNPPPRLVLRDVDAYRSVNRSHFDTVGTDGTK
jgi:hypothetical protein